ncbi:MAG: hypothetical protein L7F77_07460 [Candidatus Magnetominusculus sp. LBB02]|nr:hypothetical protein [Candidatus Magnetominusculus sp. LBB02]
MYKSIIITLLLIVIVLSAAVPTADASNEKIVFMGDSLTAKPIGTSCFPIGKLRDSDTSQLLDNIKETDLFIDIFTH